MNVSKRKQLGFTIVELLIVIVVIAILAAITIVAYNGIQQRASEVVLQSDLHNSATKLETLRISGGEDQYPSDDSTLTSSAGVTFQYTSDGGSYCLSATSDRRGVPGYYISSSDRTVREGLCQGHLAPGDVVDDVLACFAFNSGVIGGYYDYQDNDPGRPACSRDIVIPGEIGGVAVTGIGNNAFADKQLTSVTIPASVETINPYAFYNNQLTSVSIADSDGNLSISEYAFFQNQLTSITLPASVTGVGSWAFSNNHLTSLTMLNEYIWIDADAFVTNSLTTVNVTFTASIDPSAFDYDVTLNYCMSIDFC